MRLGRLPTVHAAGTGPRAQRGRAVVTCAQLLIRRPTQRLPDGQHGWQRSGAGQSLLDWVRANGGHVAPELAVVENAPCGARGVVALADCWGQPNAPLVAVPARLYLTTADAHELLCSALRSRHDSLAWMRRLLGADAPREQLGRLQPPLQLALCLAQQRRAGPASRWAPYIASLPPEPPCAWWTRVAGHLRAGGGADASSLSGPEAAVASKARGAARVFGAALGGLTALEVAWAYGQVVSRAFGSGQELALAPLVDMLNHRQGACKPAWCAAEQLAELRAAGALGPGGCGAGGSGPSDDAAGFWVVRVPQAAQLAGHEQQQQQLLLAAGEELFTCYLDHVAQPAAALLSFGWVPPELAASGGE